MKIKKNLGIIILAVLVIIMMVLSITKLIDDKLGMSIAFALFLVFTIIVSLNAKKNDVKIVEYIMLLFSILTLILLVFTFRAYLNSGYPEFKFQVLVKENTSEKNLLFNYGGRNYYTYNISEVNVIIEKTQETMSLKSALENGEVTFDEVIGLAQKNSNTEGYEMYLDGGQNKYDNDEYSIIVCGNNDVIFSTFNYKYDKSICEN